MKTAGVIAEYNPFHNGHKYQLDKIREETGADYIIIAMSGDFLQRGVPALTDKYRRTRMALSEGADLVLELPVSYATASAEVFARGGVHLLASTGVVDVLCYGCETEQPSLMKELVTLLTAESPEYQRHLRARLAEGDSFPTARSKALQIMYDENSTAYPSSDLEEFLSSPNNILALEYEKALALLPDTLPHRPISHPILRVGGGYHNRELFPATGCSSATAIRAALESCKNTKDMKEKLAGNVPPSVLDMLCSAFGEQALLKEDDFSASLYTRLWACRETGYERFADCSSDLSNKIKKRLDEFVSFTQFAKLLKSRDMTYTRVCRALIHIMLGITKKELSCVQGAPEIAYLRVLGFRRSAVPLLSAIKKEASVPLVTKVSDASHILSDDAYSMLCKDIRCADLYRSIASIRCQKQLANEFTEGLIITAP